MEAKSRAEDNIPIPKSSSRSALRKRKNRASNTNSTNEHDAKSPQVSLLPRLMRVPHNSKQQSSDGYFASANAHDAEDLTCPVEQLDLGDDVGAELGDILDVSFSAFEADEG
ncbi:hypothetical protein G7Y89_g14225 [Cudoniella acicularis]|uniref:Uncharacterized protein n=1 Tax=Cudoniella acicularis TaxID=354080 RepID=A0A8H4R4U3_9HELO|nr:hypothetical protein G7Y89_g14225 [Cudoniella acicularis]